MHFILYFELFSSYLIKESNPLKCVAYLNSQVLGLNESFDFLYRKIIIKLLQTKIQKYHKIMLNLVRSILKVILLKINLPLPVVTIIIVILMVINSLIQRKFG